MSYFHGHPQFRRQILAVVGGTRLGKSLLAADVCRRVAAKIGLADFLEIMVEDSEQVDLADFDRSIHAGVVLDGVGDALFLKRHREALQGRPKLVKSGKSATNVYAYAYTFCVRAVVATFDISAANLDKLRTDHWLAERQNVCYCCWKSPLFLIRQTCWRQSAHQPVAMQNACGWALPCRHAT